MFVIRRSTRWHAHCPFERSVTIFDIVIIYLALGAPIAVDRFLGDAGNGASRLGRAAVTGLFWIFLIPAFSHRYFKNVLRRREQIGNSFRQEDPMIPLTRYVDLVSRTSGSYPGVFPLRDSVERYLGVARLLRDSREANEIECGALFEITSHPDPVTGSVCLDRRNRSLIARHHRDAADELIRICDKIAQGSDHPLKVTDGFRSVFEATGDAKAIKRLSAMRKKFEEPAPAHDTDQREKVRWKTAASFPTAKGTAVGVRDLTLISSLQSED